MSLKHIDSNDHDRQKRKLEEEQEKFNKRQEELDLKYKTEKQKNDFKSLLTRLKFETYTKRIVGLVVFVCLIDLQLTYVLAFMDKIQIAETLSSQICVTIVGTVVVYLIRAYFDTKAEKKDEMIKAGYLINNKNQNVISKEVVENKVREIINNSGLAEHINTGNNITTLETENPEDSNCG